MLFMTSPPISYSNLMPHVSLFGGIHNYPLCSHSAPFAHDSATPTSISSRDFALSRHFQVTPRTRSSDADVGTFLQRHPQAQSSSGWCWSPAGHLHLQIEAFGLPPVHQVVKSQLGSILLTPASTKMNVFRHGRN